jgi:1-acyl-sn-glycerol-3-phosphate acyltransferase
MLKKKLKAVWYEIVSVFLTLSCKIFFRLRLFGRENIPRKGPFIVVSNHQSYLDPVLCGAPLRRPMHYLARDSLFSNWFFRAAISSINAMPIKQGEGDLTTIRLVIEMLKQGKGVCLFPEATRTKDGRIEPLKPGMSLLCRRGNAPVIPTVIDGAFECWPKHKKMFSCGSIHVQFGKPITPSQAKEMGDKKLAEHLTQTLRIMQADLRKKRGKQPYKY